MKALRTNNPAEFAVCMGMDAFRLCCGGKPRHFTVADVIRWLRLMSRPTPSLSGRAR